MGFHNRISSIVVAVLFLSTSLVALLPLEDISTEAGDTGSEPLEAFVPLPATDFHDVMWAYDSSWAIAVGDEGNISIYDPGTGVWGQLPGASFGDDLKELELLPNVGYGAVGLQGPGGGNFYVATADTAGFEKVNSPPGNFTDIIIGGEGAIMLGSPGNSSFFFQGATHTRWMPTGSLNVARYGHSATMLPGGNVLLSGGEFGGTTLASSIIYNYTTTRWTTVKTMTMGTKDHAAHRLSTGHILLTGGHDSRVPGPVNNASFYDGSTDTWADTTFMNDARSSHTMTLLQNGTSMVVGGQGNGVVLATAELLVSGVWIPLNALPAERKDHTASLLPDGNVLIVGGMDDSGQALNDCYIYNTSTNTWSQAASMTHARYGHTTTSQYGGNLVVIGGKDETANGYMLPIEIYDPWNDEWTTKGNLTLGRAFHTSTLLENGRVLITGGVTTAFAQKTAICEEYSEDWEEGQYVCLATEDRAFHTAILLPDGYVLVAGGEDDVGVLKTCELFDGGWGKWYELTGINPTDSLYDVSYDPNVENYYLVGNDSTGNGVVYTLPSGTLRTTRASIGPNILGAAYCSSDHKTYLYNDSGYLQPMEPSSSSQQSMWNNIPGFPTKPGPRHAHCMAFGAEKALAVMFGGSNAGGVLQETWLYSPFVNTWTNMTGPGSPPAREAASLCFSNETDLFYLYGGFGSNYLNDTWTYDPFTNVWTNITGGTNPPHISNHGMVFDHVNKYIWLFGGRDGAQRYNDTWRLDPNTGIWTMMPQPPSFIKKMFGHAMIWDPVENVVVVFGGRDTASLNDTYTYDTGTDTWTNKSPSNSPSPRELMGSFWSHNNAGLTIYGGFVSGVTTNEAWYYNITNNEWTQDSPLFTSTMPSVAETAIIGEVGWPNAFLFGGYNGIVAVDTFAMYSSREVPTMCVGDMVLGLPDHASGIHMHDMEWNDAGDRALLVGDMGAVFSYVPGNTLAANVSSPAITYNFLAAGYKKPASPGLWTLVARGGSTATYHEIQVTSEIKSEVYWPKINELNLLSSHTLGTEDDDISVLNGQVDVDSGTGTSTYWLKVNISDYDGLSTLDQLNAYLWYDDNSIGAASTYPPGASNNTHVHFHLDLSTDWWDIAILGNGEFTMVQNETVGINSTTQIVYLKFIMGSQIRYAGGSFTESPKGTPAADQSDRTKGLNDPDTWDMEVNLTDTHSGYANAYDEFGTYRFSMLTSSGTPGTQTGVGPPNNPVALSPTGNITFSANCPYRLNVTVTNLTGVNNPSNQINANVIGIKGGDLSGTGYLSTSNFTDENTPQTLLGTPIGWENPNNDSTNTNTSNAGGGTSVGTVVWVCHTPNAPADTYVGTAKYTLLHP